MIIKVKRKHCKAGVKGDPECCPVALAIKEARPDLMRVNVNEERIRTYKSTDWEDDGDYYSAPRSVRRFVEKFDKRGRKSVEPFNFKLDIDL